MGCWRNSYSRAALQNATSQAAASGLDRGQLPAAAPLACRAQLLLQREKEGTAAAAACFAVMWHAAQFWQASKVENPYPLKVYVRASLSQILGFTHSLRGNVCIHVDCHLFQR